MIDESSVRLTAFFGIFVAVTLWESLSPRRRLTTPKIGRWLSNITITVLGTAIVRGVFPVLAASFAAGQTSTGILNQVSLPYPLRVFIAVLAFDLIIYLQHVMFHAVPLFWRLHMMHHADLDIDVTTGLRFHPIEVLLSMGIKIAAVMIIGPPVLAVIIFEVLLNGTSMFNHGNIKMPPGVDSLLRLFVVTPDMHRVHHSVVIRETNSNFGFNFPWWDRLFGTYRAQPAAGHDEMTIGLSQFRDQKRLTLLWLLALPFIGKPGAYPLNRSGREPRGRKN
ncbi:MAG: sterol desaturase family protein [Deltaproteobacteria bacterium]|jgi:sterol desaturase/sphingolipid hydroxylase (fatty acid hydroxylase superfamily)|nr:sterol desaturase family protein [Deltaproteobacteria bacterium]